ncbi:MAG: hypothetical protein GY940_39915, partial [bacterium]|nr:hypothetical protein [bacterium]
MNNGDLAGDWRRLLTEELQLMDKAAKILQYSLEKCTTIGIKDDYDYDELDRFESLTSR